MTFQCENDGKEGDEIRWGGLVGSIRWIASYRLASTEKTMKVTESRRETKQYWRTGHNNYIQNDPLKFLIYSCALPNGSTRMELHTSLGAYL